MAESGARDELRWAGRRAVGVAPADLGACRAARSVGLPPVQWGHLLKGRPRRDEAGGGARPCPSGPGPLRSLPRVLASREPAGPTGEAYYVHVPKKTRGRRSAMLPAWSTGSDGTAPSPLHPGRTDPSVPQHLTWHQAGTE